jgi:FSR family fosmidomycin resistance protein-like MFS transporter
MVETIQPLTAATQDVRRDERRALMVAGGAHVLHDGYTDLIYVMLPIWQPEFGLSYVAVSALRALYAGTMAAFQIPATLIAERVGATGILVGGTALAGLGYMLAGISPGLGVLLVALFLGGLGSSAQHPLASSLVAHAFAGPRSLKALGTYNFTGDLGKMAVPLTASLLLMIMPWRPTIAVIGSAGIAVALCILVFMPRFRPTPAAEHSAATGETPAPRQKHGFPLLFSIGLIDSATRMAFLTYLPFLLSQKGASIPTIGIALTLVFAGGAAGKLACAFLGARIGAIGTVWLTESLTAVGILALFPLPLPAAFLLLPLIGIALNGTSSVLYGSVPDLVAADQRTRALSIFYTGTVGSGAIAPVLFGRAGDALGVWPALVLVAFVALLTLPLATLLRPALTRRYGSGAA